MALGQGVFLRGGAHRLRQAQQAQLVGDGGLGLAELLRGLLLREVIAADEPGEGVGLLPVVEVAALEIFDEREQSRVLLPHPRDQARHLAQPGQPRRAQTTLPRNELEVPARAADGQRLENAVAADALGQLRESVLREAPPGLLRIGADACGGYVLDARGQKVALLLEFHVYRSLFPDFSSV